MPRALIALLCGACAATPAKPDALSAQAHRAEAQREQLAAQDHLARYATGGKPVRHAWDPAGTPESAADRELNEADRHLRHANEHMRAADALESFEDAQCAGVPKAVRAACPVLEPRIGVEDTPRGVRIFFQKGTDLDALVSQMRCHLAFARTRGYLVAADCPLYMKGVVIAKSGLDSIEISSSSPSVAAELRARTHGAFERPVGGATEPPIY